MEAQDIEHLSEVIEEVCGPLRSFRKHCSTFLKHGDISEEDRHRIEELKQFAYDGSVAIILLRRKIREWQKFHSLVGEQSLPIRDLKARLKELKFSLDESQQIYVVTEGSEDIVHVDDIFMLLAKYSDARKEEIKQLELEFFSTFRLVSQENN